MKRCSRETGFGEPENPVNKLMKHPLNISPDPKLMGTLELLGKNTWATFKTEFLSSLRKEEKLPSPQ